MSVPLPKPARRGFALVEIAICITLVALVGIGALRASAALSDAHAARHADDVLAEAKLALRGFAQAHGRLPCPATASATGSGVATAHAGNDCAEGYAGQLPWATLGLHDPRPRGRSIAYHVIPEYADRTHGCAGGPHASNSICVTPTLPDPWPAHANALEVRERIASGPDAGHTDIVANGLAAVLVAGGVQPALPGTTGPRAGTDEARNLRPAGVSFILRSSTRGAPDCDDQRTGARPCAFDQRIAWISRGEVIHLLARAGTIR